MTPSNGINTDIPHNTDDPFADSITHLSPYKQYQSQRSPRTDIPSHLIIPASEDSLQASILKQWQLCEPTQQRKKDMEELRILLTDKINTTFYPELVNDGRRRFKVEICGSTSWGGEIDTSTDVDFVIVVSSI